MKKLTSLTLSLIFILSIFLVLPPASQASISIGNCDENWQNAGREPCSLTMGLSRQLYLWLPAISTMSGAW